MSYVTLAEAKKHLNIEPEFLEDDDYINVLIEVAVQAVEDYLQGGYPISGTTSITINKSIKHATILLISHLYVNRTIVSFGQGYEIPYSFKFLLNPYRNLTVV